MAILLRFKFGLINQQICPYQFRGVDFTSYFEFRNVDFIKYNLWNIKHHKNYSNPCPCERLERPLPNV